MKTWAEEKLQKKRARKVVTPPLRTAEPIVVMADRVLWLGVPRAVR